MGFLGEGKSLDGRQTSTSRTRAESVQNPWFAAAPNKRSRLSAIDGSVDLAELDDLVLRRASELREGDDDRVGTVAGENTIGSVMEILAHARAERHVLVIPPKFTDYELADAATLTTGGAHRDGPPLFNAWRGTPSGSLCGYSTSGSTGSAKVVLFTWRREFDAAHEFASATELGPKDTVLCTGPIAHMFPLAVGVMAPLAAGASVVLAHGRLAGDRLLELVEQHSVSVMQGVPLVFERVLEALHAHAPHSLRLCISAGEAADGGLLTRWRERSSTPLRQDWGMTETGWLSYDSIGIPGSVGLPNPGIEIRFEPVSGSDTEQRGSADGPGEIVVRGRWESQVNSFAPDSREVVGRPLTDQWLATGDVGFRGPRGELVITGRRDRLLSIYGHKVDPVEVEAVIEEVPGVTRCLVRLETTRAGAPLLRAYVVGGPVVTTRSIIDHVRARLSAHKVPADVCITDALPELASGKLARAASVVAR